MNSTAIHAPSASRTRIAVVAALLAAAFAVWGAPSASATPQVGGFGVRPAQGSAAYVTAHVGRGAADRDAIVVSSSSKRPLRLAVYPVDGRTGATSGIVYGSRGERLRGAGRWIAPGISRLTLKPGQTVRVPFSVAVPAHAAVGDHVGGIAVEPLRARTPKGSLALKAVFRTVVPVLVRVPGAAAFQPRLGSLALNPKTLFVGIHNPGRLLGKPRLAATVTGPNGYRRTVRQRLDSILPGDAIDYRIAWPDRLSPGTYSVVVRVTGGRHPAVLRRTLRLDGATSATAPPSRWTGKRILELAALAVLAAALLALIARRRRRPRRRRARAVRGRTAIVLAVAVAAGVALLLGAADGIAATLGSPSWSLSNPVAGATGVTYTYTFTAPGDSLSAVEMSVPSGTAGTPGVGTVSGVPAGTATLSGTTLKYTFGTQGWVGAGPVSISFTGLTNTSTGGSYSSTIQTISPNYGNGTTVSDTGTTSPIAIAQGVLTNGSLSLSASNEGATGVTYAYGFTTADAATLASLTMTVPAGTGGSPSVRSVSGLPAGGGLNLSGTTLTYSFTGTPVSAGTAVSLAVGGLTNTSTAGSYTAQLATFDSSGPVDTGSTGSVSITAGLLTSPSWTVSDSSAGATGVAYTYKFATATGGTFTSVTMSVPAGTGGTPSPGPVSGFPAGGSLTLSGTTLTYSFTGTGINPGTAVSIEVDGLTNTGSPGNYTSSIITFGTPWSGGSKPAVDSAVTAPVAITGGTLANTSWSLSNPASGAGGVTYTYGFTTATDATLASVTTSVPGGTAGTPTLTSVSGLPAGGSLSLSGTTLTYSFTGAEVANGTAVSLVVGGLTNTSTAGSYTSQITTYSSSAPVDSGQTGSVGIAAGALGNPSWTVSKSAAGATGVAYTYGFTTPAGSQLSSVTMTVPAGTTGTPTPGTVTCSPTCTFPAGTVTLSGTTLTYSFASVYVNAETVSIQIDGLTNTPTTGSYTSQITTLNGTSPAAAGVTPVVPISGGTLVNPAWTVSNPVTGTTGVTYGYSFTTATSATLSSVTMSVPSGTAGTPTLTSVSGLPSGGTVTLASGKLTYSFAGTSVTAGSAVSLRIGGMTNTTSLGTYTAAIATYAASGVLDTGISAPVGFSGSSLSGPVWSLSSSTAGATGVIYTYGFTTASGSYLTSVTMRVPDGTAGTPSVGTVSCTPNCTIPTGTATLSGGTLTYSFASTYVNPAKTISIEIGGMTNTAVTGSYQSQISTLNGASLVDTGLTAPISISGGALVGTSWTVSNAATKATGVTYTYKLTTASAATLDSVTMTVPPGTAGTPAVSAVTGLPAGGTIGLDTPTNTITYSFPDTEVDAGTAITLKLTGLTNTSTVGSYTANLATNSSSGPIDTGVTAPVSFTGGSLASPIWTVSDSSSGDSGVTYTYTFTTASGTSLSSITMTVPSGTAGTPTIGTVTGLPAAATTGATVSLASNTLTYSFSSAQYISGTTDVSIELAGLTNTQLPGSYTSQITTMDGPTPRDTGQTAAISITGGKLASPIWSASSYATGATAAYTYTFQTASNGTLDSVTMTVPPGTAGTPTVGAVSGVPGSGSATLATNTLTYTFATTSVPSGTNVSIELDGLKNTTTVGSYTSQIATFDGATPVDSGTTASVSFGGGALTSPTWRPSSYAAGSTGVTYAYTFTAGSSGSVSAVTMTVPPGTTGTPTPGTVSGVPTSNNVTLASNTITYSFAATWINSGTAVTIQIGGLTNTSSAGSYTAQLATKSGATPVDSAVTPTIAIANGNPFVAYVAASGASALSPLHLGSAIAGTAISTGGSPQAVAVSPDGSTASVVSSTNATLTPVTVASGSAGSAVSLTGCTTPTAIAITPNGGKAYVACSGNSVVVPVTLPAGTVGAAIAVGSNPLGVAISPDGSTAYVVSSSGLVPIATATNTAGTATALTGCTTPAAVSVTPNGATAYVACSGSAKVVPVTLASKTVGASIAVGTTPSALAIDPGGTKLYVANKGSNTVTPITISTGAAGTAIAVGTSPDGIAIAPDGSIAYVANSGAGTVTPIVLSSGTAMTAFSVGSTPVGVAFVPDQAPVASLTVTPGSAGSATQLDASASTVAYGTVASYLWNFGDGTQTTTSTPTTSHVYAAGCTYTVTVTETDSAGTSTSRVFTGQTVSRNGGSNAQTTQTFGVTRPLGFVSNPSDIAFAATLTGLDQTVASNLSLDVGDGTSSSGWSISATSTSFSTGGASPRTLPDTSVTVQTGPTSSCDGAAACTQPTNDVSYPYTLPAAPTAPTATLLFAAAPGTGVCDQTVTIAFHLAVPAGTYADTYSSTWTFTLASTI